MPLDANTEYHIDQAKKLLDSYLGEFGEHDQGDNRVYRAAEILGRLLLPTKPVKKTFVGSVAKRGGVTGSSGLAEHKAVMQSRVCGGAGLVLWVWPTHPGRLSSRGGEVAWLTSANNAAWRFWARTTKT